MAFVLPRYSRAFSSSKTTNWASAASSSSTDNNAVPSLSTCDECPLSFVDLPYSAAEVRVSDEFDDSDTEFLEKLRSSLEFWTKNDYNSAWVHVPIQRASLVKFLTCGENDNGGDDKTNTGLGFDLHHTNSTLQTIVLKKWLRDGHEDKIPPFATHQVGCAGFVLNDKNEILVIKEWSGPPSNRTPTRQWKLPGGLLDAGESFEDATCREVQEETGISCDFESILTFWHRHGLTFGKSDLYFVCLLRPHSLEITLDPVEVSAARWMAVDEFLRTQDHPLITHVLHNNFKVDKSKDVGGSTRMVPSSQMVKGDVQFASRRPFPTYTSTSAGADQ